jgi:hypothetical protein
MRKLVDRDAVFRPERPDAVDVVGDGVDASEVFHVRSLVSVWIS